MMELLKRQDDPWILHPCVPDGCCKKSTHKGGHIAQEELLKGAPANKTTRAQLIAHVVELV